MGESTSRMTRHAVALHGDAVGYSKLIADNEIETHNTVQAFGRIIEEVVTAASGELAQFVGDEFLAILPSEADGVSAAIEIQRRIAVENESLPAGRKLRFRLGVNAGDLSVDAGQWYGEAINVAARLQAMAEPGGINVSRPTLDAAGEIPVRIESMGEKRLKNIPEPVSVFRLVDEEIETDPSLPWNRRIPTRDRPSLAVSPFVNLGSEEDSHFADGLMMALTISLMRIPGVDVVSEVSTLQYRDRPFSSQQLGHELGVRYVLEGATQRAGSRVRVLTQLIDVEEGKTAWADQFEASLDDVFAAQDDIVSAIVTALDVEVIGGELARTYREEVSAEAVEIVYRGLQHMSHGNHEALKRAIEAFEEVIALQPDSPSGYTLAATNLNMAAMFGMAEDPASNYALAEGYANRALELGDPTGISQAVLASVRLQQRDWDGALEAAQQATALRPSCDLSYGTAASVMRYLGRWEDAVQYADRATELSPVFSWWFQGIAANAEFVGENYEAAADLAEELAAGEQVDLESMLTLAASQAALGRNRYAAAALEHARKTRPDLSAETVRAMLPYRDEETLSRFIEQLEAAGLE